MKHFIFLGALFFSCSPLAFSQDHTTYNSTKFTIKQSSTSQPRLAKPSFNPFLKNVTPPTPDGNSAKSHLLQQKIKSKKKYPYQLNSTKKKKSEVSQPKLGRDFGLTFYTNSGKKRQLIGGTPNDNTLAVSNNGMVLVSLNSTIYAYNLETDTIGFENSYLNLTTIANDNNNEHYFDPKLIYDEIKDRFIIVFLKNNEPSNNNILVCFSTTNDPNDEWNVYQLPGNPLDNNRWTDFPAISLTESNLYITGNLIIPDSSWQVGFDGSIIWKIEKETGYDPNLDLETTLYNDIKYNNKFIRNLHAVQGANGKIDKPYFLSNRNFDLANDTIFVLSIEDETDNSSEKVLNINVGISDTKYGVPPNARQFNTDTSDPSRGLQTNDGRVLAAIKVEDEIQFVSNSINPTTGFSSIYHGTIKNLESPEITAKIIGDPVKDFGYPNIAWTGNESCDRETIIAFNHTSPTDFPGISCVYVNNDKEYSDVTVLKEGENYVDRLGNGYERWGDYFGLQRKFNEAGKVYSFGFFGTENKDNTGWINEITSPDSLKLEINSEHANNASLCEQTITLTTTGGVPPYQYNWEDDLSNQTNISRTLCSNESTSVTIIDSRGCSIFKKLNSKTVFGTNETTVFPNPFSDQLVLHFELENASDIEVLISDSRGSYSETILKEKAKSGQNELVFSLAPLQEGVYYVRILADDNTILTEKVVKKP